MLKLFLAVGKLSNGMTMLRATSAYSQKSSHSCTFRTAVQSKAEPISLPFRRNLFIEHKSLQKFNFEATPGDHRTLWKIEKFFTVTLLALPAAFTWPSQAMDTLMALAVVLHAHWGCESVISDYIRPRTYGNTLPKLAMIVLYILSITSLAGCFYLVFNDVPIAGSIKQLWTIKGADGKEPPPPVEVIPDPKEKKKKK